jgi:hypothetical protein
MYFILLNSIVGPNFVENEELALKVGQTMVYHGPTLESVYNFMTTKVVSSK